MLLETAKHWVAVKVVAFILLIVLFLSPLASCQNGSVHQRRVSLEVLAILERDFEMSQVLVLLDNSPDRAKSKRYLHDLPFHFVATQQQGPMVMDAYAVGDFNSLVVGYSLFYYGPDGYLSSAALSVNPMNESAKQKAKDMIQRAFDSVSNPDGSTLHFLGIYDWDSKRVLKIMIRKRQTSVGPDYAIEYAVSYRGAGKLSPSSQATQR